MIDLPRHGSSPAETTIKILGVGNAGSNALDRMLLDGMDGAELIALNSDAQALAGSVAEQKIQLGRTTTRGLGAGGDPEVGYAAAEEAMEEIRSAIAGAGLVFLCVGLGGGTGSGAARIVASIAREAGALVIVFATMPFAFEGRRRVAQAEEALAAVQEQADAVICFENDKMGDAVSPRAGIQEAFAAADQTISQSVRAVAALSQRRGLIHAGLDELATALRQQNPRCLFGSGEASGDNRAHAALERALKSPLIDRGRLLEEAQNVMVTVAGGPGMTLNEVQILMTEFNRHIGENTRILFGTAVDPKLGDRMSVTILTSVEAAVPATQPTVLRADRQVRGSAEPPPLPVDPEREALTGAAESAPSAPMEGAGTRVAARGLSGAAPRKDTDSRQLTAAEVRAAKQEQMQFEPVTRGRFEKSEPTIVDGQDLDVPTFLRRNLKLR
jgi:cell division protein FtsZ